MKDTTYLNLPYPFVKAVTVSVLHKSDSIATFTSHRNMPILNGEKYLREFLDKEKYMPAVINICPLSGLRDEFLCGLLYLSEGFSICAR